MQSVSQFLINLHARRWNALVSPKLRYVDEDATHIRFLHPTKGFKRISKRRLGV